MASTTSSAGLLQIGEKHVTKGLGRLTEAIIAKGEGSYVTLHDGRRMLDFTCGIGVTSLGEPYCLSDACTSSLRDYMQGTVIRRSAKRLQTNACRLYMVKYVSRFFKYGVLIYVIRLA